MVIFIIRQLKQEADDRIARKKAKQQPTVNDNVEKHNTEKHLRVGAYGKKYNLCSTTVRTYYDKGYCKGYMLPTGQRMILDVPPNKIL